MSNIYRVVLTGFMGTGKSTVGRALATQLGWDHVDTDTVIEHEHGPIPEIFESQGEVAFREIERKVAEQLAEREKLVVSTGGGLMLDRANVASFRDGSVIVTLTASPETILGRLLADHEDVGAQRPMLQSDDPAARIAELLAERAEVYGQFTSVSTDGRGPAELAAEIAELVRAADR